MKKTYKFSDPQLQRAYDAVQNTARKFNTREVYSRSMDKNGTLTLTLCNTWQIIINSKKTDLKLRQFNFVAEQWRRANWRDLPKIHLISKDNGIAKILLIQAAELLWKQLWKQKTGKRSITAFGIFLRGRIRHYLLDNATKGLRKILWHEVIDREILSIHAKSQPFKIPLYLNEYFLFAKHALTVKRIHREHPNLIPLLWTLPASEWRKNNVFSYHQWQKKLTKAGWRWMLKAKISFLQYLITGRGASRGDFTTAIECLARANLPSSPSCALIRLTNNYTFRDNIIDTVLARLYVQHCNQLKRQTKFHEWRSNLTAFALKTAEIRDYLTRQPRAELSQILRNATFQSLLRRSQQWHADLERKKLANENMDWPSLLTPMNINNYSVTPLTSTEQLYAEGQQMHHCVKSFSDDCYNGKYQIFHLKNCTEVATLGLILINGNWRIDQIRGVRNIMVKTVTRSIAEQVAELYNRAHREQLNQLAVSKAF